MAFPTIESSVTSGNNATYTNLSPLNLTLTITSGALLVVLVSAPDPADGGISSVVWDPAGVNQALTAAGTIFSDGTWGGARIYYKTNPTAGASKTIAITCANGAGYQIGAAAISVVEAATIGAYAGGSGTSAATNPYDVAVSGVSCASGDAIVSVLSTDSGTASPAPTLTGGTAIGSCTSGSADTYNVFAYQIASSTSETLTWHVVGDASAQHYAIAGLVLQNPGGGTTFTPRMSLLGVG